MFLTKILKDNLAATKDHLQRMPLLVETPSAIRKKANLERKIQEIEDAINTYDKVIESAVVGFPHSIKGQGIFAFVISSSSENANYKEEIRKQVTKVIGPIAKPDRILLVDGLPKTRSGKIMRRILRKIASGELSKIGDTSTLIDPTIVKQINNLYSEMK